MIKVILIIIIVINSSLLSKSYANDFYYSSKVKVNNANVRSAPYPDSKYIVKKYKKGKEVYIKSCDKYRWCKLKDEDLYISRTVLSSFKKVNNNLDEKLTIKSLDNNLLKQIDNLNTDKEIIKKIASTKKTNCIKLKKVKITKNSILLDKQKDKLLQKHLKKCVDTKLIKSILSDISNYFIQKGYITTKPYLQEQNILDGILDIGIVEGIVEDIVDVKTKKSNSNIKTAFIFQKDKPLNLRDLETSLEMVNRVPSVDAKFNIKPSDEVGKSIVEVNTTRTLPFHLSLGINGEKSFNDNNPNLTGIFAYDNLFNINDILSFTYNGSRIQKDYQSTKGQELNYSFSLGSYLYEYIFSNTKYRQGVEGINDRYKATGKTYGNKFKVSKVVYRNQNNKVNISGMLYLKDTKNYFNENLIEVSSYKTTLLQLDLLHTYLKSWGQISTTYSYYKGLDWFGAKDDSHNTWEVDYENDAKFEFKKYTIESNLYYRIQDTGYSINSLFHMQYTNDYLYNNDQLTVGSSSTVRGYAESNLFGNRGWYLKNDFTKNIGLDFDKRFLNQLSLSIGFDYGRVKCKKDNPTSCGKVYGSSIGLMTSSKNINTEFRFSKPLKKLSENFDSKEIFTYNINFKF